MDRRAAFFVCAAIVSTALAPATDPRHRWVPVWLGVLYAVPALLSLADAWSRQHEPTDAPTEHREVSNGSDKELVDQPNRPVM